MSLSNPPWSHFGPYNPFPGKQKHRYYPDALSSSTLLPSLGFSISAAYDSGPDINQSVNMNAPFQDEMEQNQKLANNWEPDLPGPLVSTKQSSHVIAMEYANADPVFATKANALTITHPMTRIMKGDGNCGWRAVIFGYFETLFTLRNTAHVQQELARIKSLNTLLDQVGHQEHIYETFVDATEDLFDKTTAAIQNGDQDETFLVDAFNEEFSSNAFITHFRILTSAWMKLNPQRYQGFLSMPLDTYCATQIDTVKTEIDEIGLRALVDGIIEGAGFGVEVLYLDRSKGEAVTTHQFTSSQPEGATIRLLYRPGHYDILYRAEQTVNIEPVVNYEYAMTSNFSPWDQGALSFDVNSSLMSIPHLMADPAYSMGAPMTSMSSTPPTPASPFRISSPREMYQSPMENHAPVSSISVSSPIPSMPSAAPPPMTSLPIRSSDGPQIRLNPLVMRSNLSHSFPVTAPFRNSPYSQAHFRNQDFEPIHWDPDVKK